MKHIIHALKSDKLLSPLDELLPQRIRSFVEVKRVRAEIRNFLGPTELSYRNIVVAKTKYLAIVFEIATFDHPVLLEGHPILLLVAVVDFEAARVVLVAVGRGVGNRVGLEERPDEIVCDSS